MNKSKLLKKSIYNMKSRYNQIWVVLLIIFGLLFADGAIADVETTVLFQPPPEEEQPKDTEGAASRQLGECAANNLELESQSVSKELSLTALVPQNNYGLTTQERPNFWIYLPSTSAKQAILSIKEAGKTPHWQQSVDLDRNEGIVGIELSKDAPALEIGTNYQWAVILVCGDRPSPNDPVVASWIKRIEAQSSQSSSTSKLAKASTYAQQGIWYDALDILISQKSSQNNWHDLWNKYLESAGLSKFSDRPVVENTLLPK